MKNDEIINKAFREVRANPPSRVKVVRMKQGKEKAEELTRAIALDKAREMVAKI